jgi:CheY-like chemotaxis protein
MTVRLRPADAVAMRAEIMAHERANEDEVMQAWGLSGMIADLGGTVGSVAYSDEQARQVLSQQSFDCVILDLNLDGIYAYPITSLLQQLGIPFVFCTAYAESVDVLSGVGRTALEQARFSCGFVRRYPARNRAKIAPLRVDTAPLSDATSRADARDSSARNSR